MARISAHLDTLDALTARIVRTLVAEPPLTLVDGGAISPNIDAELDEFALGFLLGPSGHRGHRGP